MNKAYAIGINMGYTINSIGIINTNGKIISKSSVSSVHQNISEYIDTLCNHLVGLIDLQGGIGSIKGIGIASPEADYFTGYIGNTPIVQILSEKLGLPVSLTNNANAATMGEMKYGVAQGMKDFILLSLDDDVCRGVVANGEVIYGHPIFTGKSAHINTHNNRGRICKCGKKDCIEAYCSTDGIVATAIELLSSTSENSILQNIPQNQLRFEDVYDAFIEGDKLATEAYRFTGDLLGQVLSDLTAYSSPEAFILSGKVAQSNDFFLHTISESLKANSMKIYAGKTKILTSGIQNSDAVLLGTSLLTYNPALIPISS